MNIVQQVDVMVNGGDLFVKKGDSMSGVDGGTDTVDEEGVSSSKGGLSIGGEEEVSVLKFAVGVHNTGVKEASVDMGEWSSIFKFWDDKDVFMFIRFLTG